MNENYSQVIGNLGVPPILIMAIPFFATFVGTPIAREMAIRLGIVDAPISSEHKTHKKPTALLGGLPLFAAVIAGTFIVLHQTENILPESFNLWMVLIAVLVVFTTGLWDDILGMVPGVKMFLLGIGGTILFLGGVQVGFIPSSWGIAGQLTSWILTLFWILGITNSANLMDNMNGLASGTAIVAGVSILALASFSGDPVGIGLSLVLTGALLGYLPYNFPKASIFLGDAGSMTLGFTLSFLGLMTGRLPGAENSPENFNAIGHTLAPIVVMGVLVFDTFFVAFSRAKRKINFWWGGRDHTSHRFVNYGFSRTFSVILVWILGAIFGGVAALVRISPPWLSVVLTIAVFIAGVWFWRKLEMIPVESVRIGSSNNRVRGNSSGTQKVV